MVTHSFLNDSKVLTVLYAPIIAKMPTYPTHSDYYILAIKFNILSLFKFYLFAFGFVCRGKDHLQMTDSDQITPCITFLLHCQSDVNVIVLKTFSNT